MKSPNLVAYHETLHAALAALSQHLFDRSIILQDGGALHSPFEFDGIPYGTNKSANAEIATIKGKPTKKWGHATIWRSETGKYEINFYVL